MEVIKEDKSYTLKKNGSMKASSKSKNPDRIFLQAKQVYQHEIPQNSSGSRSRDTKKRAMLHQIIADDSLALAHAQKQGGKKMVGGPDSRISLFGRSNSQSKQKVPGEEAEKKSPALIHKIFVKRSDSQNKESAELSPSCFSQSQKGLINKLPVIENQKKKQGGKFLPPQQPNLRQQLKKNLENRNASNHSQYLKHFVNSQMSNSGRKLETSQNSSKLLKIADESLQLLDKQYATQKPTQLKSIYNTLPDNFDHHQEKHIPQNDSRPTSQAKNQRASSQQKPSSTQEQQKQFNLAFQNSFNTSLVVQQAFNQEELDTLIGRVKIVELSQQKSSKKVQEYCDILDQFKHLTTNKDFARVVATIKNGVESGWRELGDKAKRRKFLAREQEETMGKLKEGIANLENQLFKMKIELETVKADKKQVEKMNKENKDRVLEVMKEKEALFEIYDKQILQMSQQPGTDLQNQIQNQQVKLLQEALELSQCKENKLMYLIFKLHKMGLPVNEIYEKEVRPISTIRFKREVGESGAGGFDIQSVEQNNSLQESFLRFDSDASYDNLNLVKAVVKERPDIIPELNLEGLPEYVTSDEEEEQPLDDMQMAAMQGHKQNHKSY